MAVTLNLGLLVLRLVGGLIIAAHGSQKLFGWFGGPGFVKAAQGYEKQGYKPAWLWAFLVILGELGGGLSLAFGFLTPLGAAGIFGAMLMAIVKVHWKNGFWNSNRGIEFPLSLLGIAVGIGIAGPGTYALDPFFGITMPDTLIFGILALVALIVDLIGLYMTRPKTIPTQGATTTS